jgi:Mrp family chromosome partitioning ATPase
MSKYAQVLDETTVQIGREASPATEHNSQKTVTLYYRDLIENIFPRNDHTGKAIAFVAYSPGEGVSHVAQSVSAELATSRNRPTLITTADVFVDVALQEERLPDSSLRACELPNLWILSPGDHDGRIQEIFRVPCETATNDSLPRTSPRPLKLLRERFAHLIIDCQSIKNSASLARVAAFCDGLVLVIEADRTRPDQIELARRAIEAAQGTLLGCVLNQRKYPIPNWLYRHL